MRAKTLSGQLQVGQVWRNVRKEKYMHEENRILMMPGQSRLHLPLMRVADTYA